MKNSRKFDKHFVIVTCFSFLFILGLFMFEILPNMEFIRRRNINAVKYSDTHMLMKYLSYIINVCPDELKNKHNNEINCYIKWFYENNKEWLEELIQHRYPRDDMASPEDNYINKDIFNLESGEVYDFWGNPIQIEFNVPYEYSLISFGANGKDDQGKKDDIIRTFH